MAIKGKKKSQNRGSQARRRPATAPRPALTARRHVPWYRTPRGQFIGLLVGVVVIGLVVWAIVAAQSRSRDLEQRQEALVDYTSEVRALLQSVREPVLGMTGAPTAADGVPKNFDEDVTVWLGGITNAQQQAQAAPAPAAVDHVNQAYVAALATYASAARIYELVPDAAGKLLEKTLQRAAELRDVAHSQWQLANSLLDEERAEADLDPSDIGLPVEPGAGAAPSGDDGDAGDGGG